MPAVLAAALAAPDLVVSPPDTARGASVPGRSQTRTYLSDGRSVAWHADVPDGWRIAVDAERADQRLPAHVRARSGLPEGVSGQRALAAWTQAETMAKLTDVPILLRIREFGLGLADLGEYEPIALMSHARDGVILTVGARGVRAHADR